MKLAENVLNGLVAGNMPRLFKRSPDKPPEYYLAIIKAKHSNSANEELLKLKHSEAYDLIQNWLDNQMFK